MRGKALNNDTAAQVGTLVGDRAKKVGVEGVVFDRGGYKFHGKVKALADAFFAKRVTPEILFETGRGIAPWMASVTFGGPDLSIVYIGSLKGTKIPYFKSPVPGLPMVHWKK